MKTSDAVFVILYLCISISCMWFKSIKMMQIKRALNSFTVHITHNLNGTCMWHVCGSRVEGSAVVTNAWVAHAYTCTRVFPHECCFCKSVCVCICGYCSYLMLYVSYNIIIVANMVTQFFPYRVWAALHHNIIV